MFLLSLLISYLLSLTYFLLIELELLEFSEFIEIFNEFVWGPNVS